MRRPQSNQTAFALAVACLLALVPACSSGKNAAGVTDDNATADQYPSATLPFKARASGPKKGDNTYPFDGVEIGRSQYSRQAQGYVQEAHAILAVPVALPDVVAVIFPPADREGFDVAYAGFGKPWTR